MEVIIQPDAASASRLVARLIARDIRRSTHFVLGLATGRTMESVYAELARLYRDEGLRFKHCHSFNLDEYVGLAANDPCSYRHFMSEHLFSKIDIPITNTHVPNGLATDLVQEAIAYEKAIEKSGGIDLQLLGIGRSGHIGFNEPLSAFRSRTRDKALTPVTIAQNKPLFPSGRAMPVRGITMGIGTILDSRRCILLATGSEKAAILSQAIEGPLTSMISASALQLHPRCVVVTDEAAASQLTGHEYYRWVFANEPEWAEYR